MKVTSLHRYPVKGLSPEPLQQAALQTSGFFPGDRMFAFENGPSSFDPTAPAYKPKTRFLMLMKNARLAELSTRFDDDSSILTISHGGTELARGDVRTGEGRAAVESALAEFCRGETKGPVKLLAAPEGFRFTDSIRSGFMSILNLSSVADLESRMGVPVDPIRFRANVAVSGWTPWAEEDLIGRRLKIGPTTLKVLKAIDRCPATHVDPTTGVRDLDVMGTLQSAFGHLHCGIYVSVVEGGTIALGDRVEILPQA